MDIKSVILLLASMVDILLALVILLHNYKKAINISYALTALWAGLWGLGIGMFMLSSDSRALLFWNREFIIAAALIASGFLHFSSIYISGEEKINWRKLILIYAPNILVIAATLTPGVLISDIVRRDWGNESLLGSGYIYYGLYFACLWILSVYYLFRYYFRAAKPIKTQILYIFSGIGVSMAFGAVFDLILILLGNYHYIWIGPYAMFFFIIMTTLAIARHQLLNMRMVATEVLAMFLVLLSFLQIFDMLNTSLIYRVVIFAVNLVIALLLIKFILKEISRQEDMRRLNEKLRTTAERLEKANKELQRLDDAKSEFLSIASHQLRTPVTIIKGYISMIEEGSYGKVSPKIIAVLKNVFIASERLLNLIENLLDISRIEAGRLEFDLQSLDLAKVISPIVKDFQQHAKEKGLKLVFYNKEKTPAVTADAKKVGEVISNIIDNAVKYTPRGEIMVGLHLEGASVVFSCQDTGMGIEAEDLPRLFNKFVRGKGMMQVHTEGTGLGMYFARVVVENMGGRIWVESPGKDRGSKFSFSLPLADKRKAKKIKAN